jgi:hypothetical protein
LVTLAAVCTSFVTVRAKWLLSIRIQPEFTTPDPDAAALKENRELIDTLRRSKLFRSYERVFSEATGLALGDPAVGILATGASRQKT